MTRSSTRSIGGAARIPARNLGAGLEKDQAKAKQTPGSPALHFAQTLTRALHYLVSLSSTLVTSRPFLVHDYTGSDVKLESRPAPPQTLEA